jgi:hypothetical protein
MGWGYGPNDIAPSLYLTLGTQALIFFVLLTPWIRTKTTGMSQSALTFYGFLAITGSTALYNLIFPIEAGVTSGLTTVLFLAPGSFLNTLIFAIRAAIRTPKPSGAGARFGYALMPMVTIPANLIYWWLTLFAQ